MYYYINMILTIGSIKGGVGKTTLAVNMAVYAGKILHRHVALIDTDEQATATLFTEIREQGDHDNDAYTCVGIRGKQVRSQGKSLAGRFDMTVIDSGGRDTGAFRAALSISDMLVTPLAPRSFDFWSVANLVELIDTVNEIRDQPITTYALVNLADPSGPDNQEALDALSEYPQIKVLRTMLVRRKAWSNATSHGQAIFEHSPQDRKAIREFQSFIDTILKKS